MFVRMSSESYDPPFGWHLACEPGSAPCPTLNVPSNCSSVPLDQWVPDVSGRSILADFKLICSRSYKTPLLGSIYFIGWSLGLIVSGQLSDKLGRKKCYLIFIGITTVGGFAASLAPNWTGYAVARAMTGFGIASGIPAYIWLAECLNPKLSPIMVWVPNIFFCLAQALVSPLGATIYGWRYLLLAVNLLTLTGLLYAPFMYESPRWLATKGQDKEVYRIICKIAACNGAPKPPPPLEEDGTGTSASEEEVGATMSTFAQLCSPVLIVRFLCMCASFFSISFAFYGLGLFSPNLPFNAYAANAINALVAIPFYLVGQPLIDARWCGRKGACVGGFLVGGAGLLASTVIKNTVLSMIVYFSANGAFCLVFGNVYVWGSELFPTSIRGRVMSLMSVAARLGAVLAPFVVELGRTDPHLALFIFAVPCVMTGGLDLLLPETRGKKLLNVFEDLHSDGDGDQLFKVDDISSSE
eukprot:TRINITY_DN51566_c0_g1_i1.p1 TRINITY_DN51566_c0_g1~~TRINITY_DN51566_c0_g1_i1.p1  ORF type:complete len:541 (+),score=49.46 TRINITY_DN51566_c0_g1_i1:217-1623(+)